MSHAVFLRMIAAEPADDTARLAYADFLEESGKPDDLARCEFIRSQIQLAAFHPNDPRRRDIANLAAELFAEHWLNWWTPVCAAVGLPLPHIPSGAPVPRRFARLVFGQKEPARGYPYHLHKGVTAIGISTLHPPALADAFRTITFERGFPQSLTLLGQLTDARDVIRRWTNASPLTTLHLHGTVGRDWRSLDGEHMRGVRELELGGSAATAIPAIAASEHLPHLESLTLRPDRSNIEWPVELYRTFAASPLATRVRRLNVVIGMAVESHELEGPHLVNLERLTVEGIRSDPGDPVDWAWMADAGHGLLVSTHLTRLKELTLVGPPGDAVGYLPERVAGSLCRLALDHVRSVPFLDALRRDAFPSLTDLAVSTRNGIDVCSTLADSPLAGRLRHLRLAWPWPAERDTERELLRLANALNPERLETLALGPDSRLWTETWDALQRRFPGRVSLV